MNPLDARCHIKRNDAVCVSNLKSARAIDKAILQERPDVKIFLPFRFHFYKPKDLFKENSYRNFLGILYIFLQMYLVLYLLMPVFQNISKSKGKMYKNCYINNKIKICIITYNLFFV